MDPGLHVEQDNMTQEKVARMSGQDITHQTVTGFVMLVLLTQYQVVLEPVPML